MKKYSKQRELMIENLRHRKDHPTAEKLFIDLKKQMPELGIATVYRNLTELCEEKVITKIKAKNGPDRYDGNQKPHIHFECSNCGKITDIYLTQEQEKQIDTITKKVLEAEDAKIECADLHIEGLCKKCKK